jgi:hypothetical protein
MTSSRAGAKHNDHQPFLQQQQQPSIECSHSHPAGDTLCSPSNRAAGSSVSTGNLCSKVSSSYARMLPLVPLVFGVLLAASAMGRKLADTTQQQAHGPWEVHPSRRLIVNTTHDALLQNNNQTQQGSITAGAGYGTGQAHLRANSSISDPQSASASITAGSDHVKEHHHQQQQHVSIPSGSSNSSGHHSSTVTLPPLNSSTSFIGSSSSNQSVQQTPGSQQGLLQQHSSQLQGQQTQVSSLASGLSQATPAAAAAAAAAAATLPPPLPASSLSLPSPPGVLTCTPEQASEQAAHFRTRSTAESACAPHVWLDRLQAMHPGGHHTFIE